MFDNTDSSTRIKQNTYWSGAKVALPIAIGYLPIAITFGVVARSAGIPGYIVVLMSVMVFAGASQFVAVNLLAGGAGILGIIITVFFVNLRHILMSATTSEKLKHEKKNWLALFSFGITDENFSIISTDSRDELPRSYVAGLISVPYFAWVTGTTAGVLLGESLPTALETSMEIALYAMFIGLLVPELKTSRNKTKVSLLALGMSSFIHWNPYFIISDGWLITLSTLFSALFAAAFFTEGGE
ncbi:MAG: AzlC family ABC transporter permease [Bacillota bacterium]